MMKESALAFVIFLVVFVFLSLGPGEVPSENGNGIVEPPPAVERKCGDGTYLHFDWECRNPFDSEQCASHTAKACCNSRNDCATEQGTCISIGQSVKHYKNWICFEGKWDKCLESEKCETLGQYYCNGEKWVRGSAENCSQAEAQAICPGGTFLRGNLMCLDGNDMPACNSGKQMLGCCNSEQECWNGAECFSTDFSKGTQRVLCLDGRVDYCTEDDACQARAGYYCLDGRWARGTRQDCELILVQRDTGNGNGSPGNGACPEGQFSRGEWDCWQDRDDQKCNTGSYEYGCCRDQGSCFFGGSCHANDSLLAEGGDWLCFGGRWDKCTETQECGTRGSYYCFNGAWQLEEPAWCETRLPDGGLCPGGMFLIDEWQCWQDYDSQNCDPEEYVEACCRKGTDCYFGGRCANTGTVLGALPGETDEWLCYRGLVDKCTGGEHCSQRGQFYCNNGAWQGEKPAEC